MCDCRFCGERIVMLWEFRMSPHVECFPGQLTCTYLKITTFSMCSVQRLHLIASRLVSIYDNLKNWCLSEQCSEITYLQRWQNDWKLCLCKLRKGSWLWLFCPCHFIFNEQDMPDTSTNCKVYCMHLGCSMRAQKWLSAPICLSLSQTPRLKLVL